MVFRITALLGASVLLQGCLAAEIVTAPIDAVTTTQSEADQDLGRSIRKRNERIAELEKDLVEEREDCADGDDGACAKIAEMEAELRALRAEGTGGS